MTNLAVLQQAVTAHATRATEKLRRHGLEASHMQVFFHAYPHNGSARDSTSRTARLFPPSNTTMALVGTALACAARGWKGDPEGNGYAYTKAGYWTTSFNRSWRPLTYSHTSMRGGAAFNGS